MKAAVFKKEGVLTVQDKPIPEIVEPDEVLIKVLTCSVCGTDVHMTSVPAGYPAKPGTILGHELVGRIEKTGDKVKTLRIGDKVVVNPNDYCGVCDMCKANLPNHCRAMKAMGIEFNGGFAEYVKTTEKVVYKIPDSLDTEIAAFAEPLACALNAYSKLNVKPASSAVVIGAGPIGLLFIQIIKASGAYPIISIEPNERRRNVAINCGADFAIDPMNENTSERVQQITAGRGADNVFDVVGSQLATAIELVAKRGNVVLFGNNAMACANIKQSTVTYKEARIIGSWLANATFPQAVELLDSGKLSLKPLITHRYQLDDVVEAIETMRQGDGIEVLVNP